MKMAEYLAPGVYVEEVAPSVRTIEGASTSTAGFIGVAERGPLNEATLITSVSEFQRIFGRPLDIRQRYYLGHAVEGFFREGGARCYVVRVAHYTDILDRDSVEAEAATTSFDNAGGTSVLDVEASSPGTWGTGISVAVQNSSKFGTTLRAGIPASTFDRVTLTSVDGVVPGTMLWLVRPIFATVTYDAGTLRLDRASILSDPDGAAVADGATIPGGSLVITPDFRFMAITAAFTLAISNPALTLTNTSDGIGDPNHDVFDRPLPEGQVVWIVETARSALGVVARVEGNQAILTTPITTTQGFAVNTKVLARDYRILVREAGSTVEVHDNLSTITANGIDFAPNRLNSGRGASARLRVTATESTSPLANAAFRALAGSADDGLDDLSRHDYVGSPVSRTGIFALDGIDEVSTLVVPHPRFNVASDLTAAASSRAALVHVYGALANYCEQRRYLFCIIDSQPGLSSTQALAFRNAVGASNYAAFYYPWVRVRPEGERRDFDVPPSGWIAGVYAYTDAKRGVHKAPAGVLEGRLKSVAGVERVVVEAEQNGLNNNGVDVIRSFTDSGVNVWGARTIASDQAWKYVNVRRLLNFIEKSIDSGTQWAVFEPNDLALWKKLERNVGDFLRTVWRSGALFGEVEKKAFFVRCNTETNFPETIEAGQVITEVGVAPVEPAEFVIFRISQSAAGAAVSE
jgi:uncharacterized protein